MGETGGGVALIIMVVAEGKKLRAFVNMLMELYSELEDIVIPLDDGMSAVQFAFHNPVDIVYTELRAPLITGLDVARLIRQKRPGTAIHLIADTRDYIKAAVKNGYDGYYLGPVSVESLRENNLLKNEASE